MIRRKDEIRTREITGAQGGNGTVTFHDWLLPEEAKNHGKVFSTLCIPPGCSIGYHTHEGTFEAYLVLSGEATVNDNGVEAVLHAGDMNYCDEGQGHSTENKGPEDLWIMALIMNA